MSADAFDFAVARRYFGAGDPCELADMMRREAPMTLKRAASALPDEESRFRVWLAGFAFHLRLDPRSLLTDPRFIARAEALIAVREKAERAGTHSAG